MLVTCIIYIYIYRERERERMPRNSPLNFQLLAAKSCVRPSYPNQTFFRIVSGKKTAVRMTAQLVFGIERVTLNKLPACSRDFRPSLPPGAVDGKADSSGRRQPGQRAGLSVALTPVSSS